MNKYLEQFYEEYDLFDKEYLPEAEQERLNTLDPFCEENPFEMYGYEQTGINEFRFYIKKPIELSENEINNIIIMKLLRESEEMNSKQSTIKNILIFWCILTIIGIVLPIFLLTLR